MNLEWQVGVTPDRPPHVMPTRGDQPTFLRALDLLLREEKASMEVSPVGSAYPLLTRSTHDGLGVVHRFDDADTCLLLLGDRQVPPEDSREFLIDDVSTDFTGEFISA